MPNERTSEWFVPKFGPKNFRIIIGMLFLPYTAIITCFAALGSLSGHFEIQRLIAVCVIYFLSIGISAHFLDAVCGKTRPWGNLPKNKTVAVAIGALCIAFSIGLYYAFLDSPLLFPIGIAEGFFLFAYNLELFDGRFHNRPTTIVSWSILPVFAGSAIQTNTITIQSIEVAVLASIATWVLITVSRKYKMALFNNGDRKLIRQSEFVLVAITCIVISSTLGFFVYRIF